jgi:putative transposase
VTTAGERRQAVSFLIARHVSERRSCELAGISRSSLHYQAKPNRANGLMDRLLAIAKEWPRYGHRRLWAQLRREGWAVNRKRVLRWCRRFKLTIARKKRRKRRGVSDPIPTKAERIGHVWTYDFVEDRCENGQKLRMLTLVDEFTRECHAIEVDKSLPSSRVIEVLDRVFAREGPPEWIRSDNGSEFIAKRLVEWLRARGSKTKYIDPGKPWQNGYCESFNGRFREECLDMELFQNRAEARVVIETWRRRYNHERLHSSLGYRPPVEFRAEIENGRHDDPPAQGDHHGQLVRGF